MHDKYALFVWPAYAVTALAFAWMVLDTLIRARAWRRRVAELEARPKSAAPEAVPGAAPGAAAKAAAKAASRPVSAP